MKKTFMTQAPILVVDDDTDDLEMIQAVVEEIKITRPVQYFSTGAALLNYLRSTEHVPFVIVCDMNLPGETGFDIKKQLAEEPDLQYKSVPFIYWSTNASEKKIQKAYDLQAQGFFFKPTEYKKFCHTFQTIIDYWEQSQHPKRIQ